MYQKIIVGIAFHDDEAIHRAITAANLLRSKDGTVLLLHVVEDLPRYVSSQIPHDVIAKARGDANEALQKIAADSESELMTHVIYGHSGRTLVDYADTHAIDCIVVSSHQPAYEDYLLGSTAAFVARHATCAVHILR